LIIGRKCLIIFIATVEKRYIMDISGIQEFLNQIDGVEYCKVVGNEKEILEIHILSDSSRSPKQIVRDIETAIMTKFDFRIDRKVISIVQFKGSDSGTYSRIRLSGVSTSSQGNAIAVEVKLLNEDKEFSSKLLGVNTISNKNRLIAEATLKAVEEIIGQAFMIYVNEVIVKELSEFTIATVVVTLKVNYFEEFLVGSAVVRNDLNESISRATLDAVNRRIKGIRL
jgi:hypothetical protein